MDITFDCTEKGALAKGGSTGVDSCASSNNACANGVTVTVDPALVAAVVSALRNQNVYQPPTPVRVHDNTADGTAFGLVSFGMAVLMVAFAKMGIIEPESSSLLTCWGFFIGGFGQFSSGLVAQKRGDSFGALAFVLFGCSCMAQGAYDVLTASKVIPAAGPMGIMAKAFIWMVFAIMLGTLSLRISWWNVGILSNVTCLFLTEAIGAATGINGFNVASGVFALGAGLLAFSAGFFLTFNNMWGREVFNLGFYRPVPTSLCAEKQC